MSINRSVPVNGVLPELYYKDADQASVWLQKAFGFELVYVVAEDDRRIHIAQLRLGEAYVMIRYENDRKQSPLNTKFFTQSLRIIVDDVDHHYSRAKSFAVDAITPPQNQIYGEREYSTYDLEGHRWIFSQHIDDVDPIALFGSPPSQS